MFKRGIAYILAVLMIVGMLGFTSTAFAATPTLTVNGTKIDAKLFTKSKLPMLPLRLICEELGYTYSYKSGKATITTSDDVLKLTKGSRYYYDRENTKIKLGTYPVLQYSMLYAPSTFFTDMMGMDFTQDSSGNYILKTATAVSPQATAGTTPTPTPAVLGNIYLNDKQLSGNAYANAMSKLYVPLESIVTAFGGTMTMQGNTAIVTVSGGISYVSPSQTMYTWNGQNFFMLSLPEMSNNVLYVPIEYIEKVFSATYLYSNNVLKIYSTTGIAQSEFNVRLNSTLLSVRGYTNIAGKTMLPVKQLGEALGFAVTSDGTNVNLVKGTLSITFVPGQTTYYSGWSAKTYPASETRNNEVFIPIEMATELMGIAGSSTVSGELVLSTSGAVTGGIPIRIKRGDVYVDTGLYAKASGSTLLIPINDILGDFGYSSVQLTSGSTFMLNKKADAAVTVPSIQFTIGSTQMQFTNSTTLNGYHVAQAAPEISGATVYFPIDILKTATGITYSGSPTTNVTIG